MQCIATVKSMTFAMKGVRLLKSNRINADVIKVDPNMTRRGCSFGISFDCSDSSRVRDIFIARRFDFGDIIGERDKM